jgi:hypothetical protein
VRPEDDIALAALYESLDVDDRYARFASAFHPRPAFYAALTTVGERGGARLVAAFVAHPSEEDRIIGEAGYSLLHNGDGELEMTVERGARSWLGPYLLDALVETAAASGVPNLEADVPTVDHPMLAWLRSRGSVAMEHDGWRRVRLLIGTSGPLATWPGGHERPRLLVECAGGRWRAEDVARAAGLDVLVCPGPAHDERRCPVQEGEPCPLAAGADFIVVADPCGDERWRTLVAGHGTVHPDIPVVTQISPKRGRRDR